jgi:hypothetical protein
MNEEIYFNECSSKGVCGLPENYKCYTTCSRCGIHDLYEFESPIFRFYNIELIESYYKCIEEIEIYCVSLECKGFKKLDIRKFHIEKLDL